MNYIKKILAVITAAVIMSAAIIPVFAEETEETATTGTPSACDSAAAYIYNVEDDGEKTVVVAYQIIEAVYGTNGLTGYKIADNQNEESENEESDYAITISSLTSGDTAVYVSSKEAQSIASAIKSGGLTLNSVTMTYDSNGDYYYADLSAGTWIVLISNSDEYVYNPIIVSNYYTDANDASSLQGGSVYLDTTSESTETAATLTVSEDGTASLSATLADGTYYIDVDGTRTEITVSEGNITTDLTGLTAGDYSVYTVSTSSGYAYFTANGGTYYAKKSTISIEKSVNESDVDIGDTVTFTITSQIPEYASVYYSSVTYKISDLMDSGLTLDASSFKITVGDDMYSISGLDEDATSYTITKASDDDEGKTTMIAAISWESSETATFTIEFDSDYILANTGKTVVVTYNATLNENAALNENKNSNTATITYTNSYTESTYSDSDGAYVYTFAIDDELNKVYTDGSATAREDTVTVTNPLAGAEFTIYYDSDCATVVKSAYGYDEDENRKKTSDGITITNSNGNIMFEGLDAGTYYVTETTAPSGYSLNDTVYKVVIEADYDDGTLVSYTVTISDANDESSTSYESKYTVGSDDDGEESITAEENPIAIVDTSLQTLPSTGGVGRIIIIAVSAAAACVIVFAFSRKKKEI